MKDVPAYGGLGVEKLFKGPFQPRPFCDSTLNAALPILLESLYRKNMKIWIYKQMYKIFSPLYLAQGQIFINASVEPMTTPGFRYKICDVLVNILFHAVTK